MLTSNSLRNYCINNNLFTKGDVKQYSIVLNGADYETFTIHELATMIWICSSTNKTIRDIVDDLNEIAKE